MSNKGKSSAETGDGTALVPKLRFPMFEEAEGWKQIPLQKLARPITDRATTGDADNVLSLSGEHGLVLQSEYFGKKIAGDSTDRYLKIRRNDFVYNDRTTKASSFGTIKRLSNYSGGIVSPIYKCFRFHPTENPAFWEWYFESGSHDPALGGLVNEGSRAGRFNISVTQFLSTNAWRPDEKEQQKIAECLASADTLLEAQMRKVEALTAHKKGLMQQLFPRESETQPRLRFPEFEGAAEWRTATLGELLAMPATYGIVTAGNFQAQGVPMLRGGDIKEGKLASGTPLVAPEISSQYKRTVLKLNDVVIALVGYPGEAAVVPTHYVGANISRAVGLLRLKDRQSARFVAFYLNSPAGRRSVLKPSAGSAQVVVNLKALNALVLTITEPAEQQRIADCLTSLNNLIAAETRMLDMLKTHKRGLMQQLFPEVGVDDA